MIRLRIKVIDWPRRALALTDTPRPNCPNCRGEGGNAHVSVDANGEYDGTDWYPCDCWDENRRLILLPLPRHTPPGGYSDEPPF
ncbi:hypothetical protein ABZX99_02875 [Streptomyces antibioticus]|uniref:hypothetical protein n=1 Tax=Streptomyces antibioticus TaxID=1890 RepID=UPI0033A6C8E3